MILAKKQNKPARSPYLLDLRTNIKNSILRKKKSKHFNGVRLTAKKNFFKKEIPFDQYRRLAVIPVFARKTKN